MIAPRKVAALTVVVAFHAFSKNYRVGDEVPQEDVNDWESRFPGTLQRRINRGYLTYTTKDAPKVDPTTCTHVYACTKCGSKLSTETDSGNAVDDTKEKDVAGEDGDDVEIPLEIPQSAQATKEALAAWLEANAPLIKLSDKRKTLGALIHEVQVALINAIKTSESEPEAEETAQEGTDEVVNEDVGEDDEA